MTTHPFKETFIDIRDSLHLTRKSLLRSVEFQLFFDIAYIFFLIFIANMFLRISVDFFDKILFHLRVGSAIERIPYLSFINFHAVFVLVGILFFFALFYLIETNAIIIITSSYYRNTPISSLRAFLRSCIKTPYVLMVRIIELRMHFYILIGLYFFWQIILQIFPQTSFLHWGNIGLMIYLIILVTAILFHYTMSTYVICLEKNESPYDFDDQITIHANKKHARSTIAFYILFLLIAIIWVIFFSMIMKGMIFFSHQHPLFVSDILTLFIAGTIMSIFVFLSITKTLRISILTIIYYSERYAQHKTTPIIVPMRSRGQKKLLTMIIILTIVALGMCIITFSVYTKTALLVSHTEDFLHEQHSYSLKNVPRSSDAIANRFFSKDYTTIDIIENTLFTYISLLIKK
jgi:hypothetical protein